MKYLKNIYHLLKRFVNDFFCLRKKRFTAYSKNDYIKSRDFESQISISQMIKPGKFTKNKIHNMSLAINKIENLIIEPGEIFSFWKILGKITSKKGYLQGRAIINDRLNSFVGGGLCQLSGLLYFLALKSGLQIVERHPHSQDIYTKKTRFTPLGSDAAVVYPNKDLRILNNFDFPLCFRFSLNKNNITGYICSEEKIIETKVIFIKNNKSDSIKVITNRLAYDSKSPQTIDTSIYLKPQKAIAV